MLINHTVTQTVTQTMRFLTSRHLNLRPTPRRQVPPPQPNHSYTLYAHVPFCESLCPYCSFNRFLFQEGRARAYFQQLRVEMRLVASQGYRFQTLYIGGGTPTVLVDELIETIELAHRLFPLTDVSCETNPNHMTPENVRRLSPYIQRMSVGVQSFNDLHLKHMLRYDRFGSGADILRQLALVQDQFKFLNIDLIFNLPGQTEEQLLEDVAQSCRSGANQITFYPLMSSPSVSQALRTTLGQPNYANERRFYDLIVSAMQDRFQLSTVWNFGERAAADASSGADDAMIDEYIINYAEYVGIGSGAFSYLDGRLYVNTFSVNEYAWQVQAGHMALTAEAAFGRREQMLYRFMMDLFGLQLDKIKFRRDFGVSVDTVLAPEITLLSLAGAFSRNDRTAITLSGRGRYLLLIMMREFFVGMNTVRDQARAALPETERLQLCATIPTS
ncbi:MAG TPA: coproporphyrinogen III oxidase family protein [Anaerolineaceae bacterium]|nr:coproporphyrinogen III oxidase family protein [Anaerolineaceae bacterium]